MGLTLGIVLLHTAYNELPDLISYKASLGEIILYFLYSIPSQIPVVLPVSLLLSVIFTLSNMHRNNEIIAMKAAGIHIFRISRSLWGASLVLAGILFYMNAHLVPYSVEASRITLETLRFDSEKKDGATNNVGIINYLAFNNRLDSRIWFMNRFSQSTNIANGIEVHVLDESGNEKSAIKAREGVFDDVDNCWFFTDGQEIFFDTATGRPIKLEYFDKKYYKDFNEDPTIMKLSTRRPKDLSVLELQTLISSLGDKNEMLAYNVALHGTMTSPLVCIIVVALAIPFSIAGVRTNPMVGVSKSVALFFAYYVILNIFTALGSRGILSPAMAAWAPNIIALLFALSLYRKNI